MEKQIGHVTHYFDRIGVAVLDLEDSLATGEHIHIAGQRTDFKQRVDSLEVDHHRMQVVGAGANAALKVLYPVHDGDIIYRIEPDRPMHF